MVHHAHTHSYIYIYKINTSIWYIYICVILKLLAVLRMCCLRFVTVTCTYAKRTITKVTEKTSMA